jgi:3,4-dihydroxy 2-butanone 4-phosphate synthase/GTP cyclohydrolase II
MPETIDLPFALNSLLSGMNFSRHNSNLPWVTLSYAQSLDGSIAARRNETLALSGSATRRITHHLRARHSAILVGIGTLLADDPQLNVRLVPGADPQPVVLDRELRFPKDARLMGGKLSPWIITTQNAQLEREEILSKAGARVFRMDNDMNHIFDILLLLSQEGINSVMVEGGAGVITSFMQSRLVDIVVLTIASRFVGGVRGIESLLVDDGPHLEKFGMQRFDEDLLIWGYPRWTAEA